MAGVGCDKVVVSTDHVQIARHAMMMGADVDARPDELAQDDSKIADVLAEYFGRGIYCDICVLLQPTSPLVRQKDVADVVAALMADEEANSAQTVCEVPHNYHAWNQRVILDYGRHVEFMQKDRSSNKQDKPSTYKFGNVVAFRPKAMLEQREVFALPSIPIVIPEEFAVDVDGPEDLNDCR